MWGWTSTKPNKCHSSSLSYQVISSLQETPEWEEQPSHCLRQPPDHRRRLKGAGRWKLIFRETHSSQDMSRRACSATPNTTQTRDKPRLLKDTDLWRPHQSGFAEVFPLTFIFHSDSLLSLSLGHALHPSNPNPRRGAEAVSSEQLASPAGENRAQPAAEGTVTCPGSLQGPAQCHSGQWQQPEQPSTEPGWPRHFGCHAPKGSQGLPWRSTPGVLGYVFFVQRGRNESPEQMCLSWANWKETCLLLTQQCKWASWLGWLSH